MPAAQTVAQARGRKRLQTHEQLQSIALRAVQREGYSQATVERIAAEAGISLRTFYRYFPTKEAVILYDPLDLSLHEAILAMPRNISPIEAIRLASQSMYQSLSETQHELLDLRHKLIVKNPELRMHLIAQLAEAAPLIAAAVAQRLQKSSNSPEIEILASSIIGVVVVTLAAVARVEEYSLDGYQMRLYAELEKLEKYSTGHN